VSAPRITTVVCDYGGVLTNPLAETFAAFADAAGVPVKDLQRAFDAATARHGRSPMADLETARCTEAEMVARVLAELPGHGMEILGGRPFGELWFRGRTANAELLAFLRGLRADGYRLALLTNNVREWERRWRATIPVEELFTTVVDSSQEGVRKPDPEIYRRLLARIPATAQECLFLDDTEENLITASELGMEAVLFTSPRETVDAITAVLDARGIHRARSSA